MDPAPPPDDPFRPYWIAVGVCAGICAASFPLDAWCFPEDYARDRPTVFALVGSLSAALAHALWISLDRRRRGKKVGAWRFFAFILAPLAIPVYLLLEYRLRGLLYCLAYFGLLVGVIGVGVALGAVVVGLRA